MKHVLQFDENKLVSRYVSSIIIFKGRKNELVPRTTNHSMGEDCFQAVCPIMIGKAPSKTLFDEVELRNHKYSRMPIPSCYHIG